MTVDDLIVRLREISAMGGGELPVYLGDWNERYARPTPLTTEEISLMGVEDPEGYRMTVLQFGDIYKQ